MKLSEVRFRDPVNGTSHYATSLMGSVAIDVDPSTLLVTIQPGRGAAALLVPQTNVVYMRPALAPEPSPTKK